MTRSGERVLARGLWILYGVLALGGLALLGEALFLPRPPRPFQLKLQSADALTELQPIGVARDGLLSRRVTRRVAVAAPPAAAPKSQELPLDRLIKLTGILDFGGKQPTLSVIETPG